MLGKPQSASPQKASFELLYGLSEYPKLLQSHTADFGFQNLNNQDCLCNIAVVTQSVHSEQKLVYIKILRYSIME